MQLEEVFLPHGLLKEVRAHVSQTLCPKPCITEPIKKELSSSSAQSLSALAQEKRELPHPLQCVPDNED